MARPKKDRTGKLLTLYLTADRLDKLGTDPRTAIYALIDGKPDAPKSSHRTKGLCPTCRRRGDGQTPLRSCKTCNP